MPRLLPLKLGWIPILFVVIAVVIAAPPALAAPKFPPLTGRVVDDANLLSPAARQEITGWLAAFERDTKHQVVVATVPSLQGYTIEDYGYQLGRFWGIGEKGKNTGAILLVAPKERKVRIEVGYGLEGELTDALSSTIINEDILPAFRRGDYQAGIRAGTAAMLRALGWTGASAAIPPPPPRQTADPFVFISPFFLFIMLMIFLFRIGRHRRGPPGGGFGSYLLGYGLGSMMSGGFGGRGFGGGGFGGSGGFSGGGGSFGGGGSSGSW